jgi:gamma-glutamyltranspeptidase/glutathione hydrolase
VGMSTADGFAVTEDLVRYMDAAMSFNGKFLIEDPTWAIDFAPNGESIMKVSQFPRRC